MAGRKEQIEDAIARGMTRVTPTRTLCGALLNLDSKPQPTEAERHARAFIMDVLCGRFPEARAAFNACGATYDTHAAVDVIVAAARAAAGIAGRNQP